MSEYSDSSILASGTTSEAVVFYGCTTTELVTIVIGSLIIWVPILALVGIFIIGNVLLCLGFVLVAVGITAVLGGRMLQGWKRGRPEGFYQQAITLRLSKYNLVRNTFVTVDGQMSLGRSHKVVVFRGDYDE